MLLRLFFTNVTIYLIVSFHLYIYIVYVLINAIYDTSLQASLDVLPLDNSALWWAGKEMIRGKQLCDYIGKNEKTKIICKIQKV